MNIVVYCSAKDSIPEEYLALGDALGQWIGAKGHTLVYGGATGGLMTRTSEAAKAAGAEVIGVIPSRIIQAGRKAENCSKLVHVVNMSSRKQVIRDLADVIVCLPGSYGTLDEMMDATSSGVVGEHKTPLFVLNYKDFYTPLVRQIAYMKELRFLPAEEHYKPVFLDTLDELYAAIDALKK